MFLPTATLALMVLSVLAMLSYRNALVGFTAAARSEALKDARLAAGALTEDASTSGALRRAFGRAADVAFVQQDGSVSASIGRPPGDDPFAPLDGPQKEAATAGPTQATEHRIIVWLPMRSGLTLRLEQPAPALAEEWMRWRRLMIVVTSAVGALATLLMLYLRRLFKPIDSLLKTARELDGEPLAEGDDEVEFLVRRFERAMSALRQERQAAEDAEDRPFDEQIETLEQTFSHLESGMALIDLEGTVLALNDVGARTLGLDPARLPQPIDSLLTDHGGLADLVGTAVRERRSLRREECSVSFKGRQRALGLTLSPLSRQDGTQRGWIMLFADLTDARQQAEREQLSSSLDQLAALSAGLAHELRNSLASMQGYAALLTRAQLPSAAAADTRELQREIDQLHRIVEDFLSFARPGDAQLGEVDLLRLAHRAAGDPVLEGAPVKVRTQVDSAEGEPTSWTVKGDEQLLHRLLRNLLLNAVRAQRDAHDLARTNMSESGSVPPPVIVTLHSKKTREGANISLAVEDNGTGITPAMQERLFVPFSTDSPDGSGLGLAVARRIADLHGAQLTVKNRAEGQGVAARLSFASG